MLVDQGSNGAGLSKDKTAASKTGLHDFQKTKLLPARLGCMAPHTLLHCYYFMDLLHFAKHSSNIVVLLLRMGTEASRRPLPRLLVVLEQ